MTSSPESQPMPEESAGPAAVAPLAVGNRETVRLVTVGHVDHGKSTLVGRLLHDTDSLPEGKAAQMVAVSQRRGREVEWAFVLDALQAERDQGITIDTTQIWFKTPKRDYVIIDAPGHKEFLKNMITGAASADAALLLCDAAEGVQEQTRRHGYLLHLLGIRQVVVVINKMDLVGFAQKRYAEVVRELNAYLADVGIEPLDYIPVEARSGANIARRAEEMPWYDGDTVLTALDRFQPPAAPVNKPLRMPVQDVYKFDDRRIIAGRIESGILRVGDRVHFAPGDKAARVKSIESWNTPAAPVEARAGQSVGFTLDDQLFVERGMIVCHDDEPPIESNVFRATVFWLAHAPMQVGAQYRVKLGTTEFRASVQAIERVVDVSDLSTGESEQLERNEVAEVVLRARRMLALDEYRDNPATGRFALIDGYDIAGGGIINMEGYPDQSRIGRVKSTNITQVAHAVSAEERFARNGHRGGVLWLTGLSGAGKSTLAMALERELHQRGYQAYVLDGDNVRSGLNADLGFAPEDRAENIRRVGEVAALFANAGMIVITAFISPYQADRDRAREAAHENFHEIFVDAALDVCEQRDPKGLYRKARSGEIAEFTGISSPYEAPQKPELTVDTAGQSIEQSVAEILEYISAKLVG
jgi:bifunctional enzyme CysN/CysC